MAAIPVVGTSVGGTDEVLQAGPGWAVPETADPAAYVSALRELLSDTQAARAGALKRREALLAERTDEAFEAALADVLGPHA